MNTNLIIKTELEDLQLKFPEVTQNDVLFEYLSLSILYLEGVFDNRDVQNYYTGGANDGGVDAVYEDDDYIYVIQAKFSAEGDTQNLTKGTVLEELRKMTDTVKNLRENRTQNYNDNLNRILRRLVTTDKQIKFIVVTNRSVNDVEGIHADFDSLDTYDDISELDIVDGTKLASEISSIRGIKRHVGEGVIDIYKEHGMVKYLDSIVVNVRASSLKKIHADHKDEGLYGYNLRHFVSIKKIDDRIRDSLKNVEERSKFWEKNNGLVIACEDFRPDAIKVHLTNFSIINGCQTTSNIAKHDGSNTDDDFPIICKIIKTGLEGVAHEDYVAQLAISSNSQKPIQFRDHRSNHPLQENLYNSLKDLKTYKDKFIHCEIKKGRKPKRARDKTYSISNTEIGKLILDMQQTPGMARSQPGKMWSDDVVYKRVFSNAHSRPDLMKDLIDLRLILADYINTYIKNKKESSNETIKENIDIYSNGIHFIIAFICYFLKRERIKQGSNNSIDPDNFDEMINDQLYDHEKLFNDGVIGGDNFKNDIEELMAEICALIRDAARTSNTPFHNFTKKDTSYVKLLETIHANVFGITNKYNSLRKIFKSIFILES